MIKGMKSKRCTKCKEVKFLRHFYKNRYWRKPEQFVHYYRSRCRKCVNELNRPENNKTIKKYPGKQRSRIKFRSAVIQGKIKYEPCKVCGETKNIQAHHTDYRKPYNVIFLCRQHHYDIHSKRLKI